MKREERKMTWTEDDWRIAETAKIALARLRANGWGWMGNDPLIIYNPLVDEDGHGGRG